MGIIRQVTNRDTEKRGAYEPFAAIHYDGSYASARAVLGMIGVDNMNLSPADKKLDLDDLIDKLMDENSNLKLPEVVGSEDLKLVPLRSLTLRVESWMVLEVSPEGAYTEIVFYPEQHFNSKYEVVK